MADLKENIDIEVENIERVLSELPGCGIIPGFSILQLAGVGALLQSLYNGMESIIKQIMHFQGIDLPQGFSWHRDLINIAVEKGILLQSTAENLKRYLAFRHFFVHTYSIYLEADKIVPLVQDAHKLFASFIKDINRFISEK